MATCWSSTTPESEPIFAVEQCVSGCLAGAALCRIDPLLTNATNGATCRSSCATKLDECEAAEDCVALDCCLARCDPIDTACNTACSNAHLDGVVKFAYANQCVGDCLGVGSGGSSQDISGQGGTAGSGAAANGGVSGNAGSNCGDRLVIVEAGNLRTSYSLPCSSPGSGCDGSGLVKDTQTGLEWQRFRYQHDDSQPWLTQTLAADYCTGKGMRLPTQQEALGIVGANGSACAWPDDWWTWTSSSAEPGLFWYVIYNGNMVALGEADGAALCVR